MGDEVEESFNLAEFFELTSEFSAVRLILRNWGQL